jgi:hypothetical protein
MTGANAGGRVRIPKSNNRTPMGAVAVSSSRIYQADGRRLAPKARITSYRSGVMRTSSSMKSSSQR